MSHQGNDWKSSHKVVRYFRRSNEPGWMHRIWLSYSDLQDNHEQMNNSLKYSLKNIHSILLTGDANSQDQWTCCCWYKLSCWNEAFWNLWRGNCSDGSKKFVKNLTMSYKERLFLQSLEGFQAIKGRSREGRQLVICELKLLQIVRSFKSSILDGVDEIVPQVSEEQIKRVNEHWLYRYFSA